MKRRAHLTVTTLESRELPAQFGIPWANGTALTVSFAPDGTNVDGSPSRLFAMMSAAGISTSVWQGEILRALQTWTASADLNIGVVSDSGAPLGAAGYAQSDARFGDIRIFAAPLAGSVLAITTPPGDLSGTRTGDIILNSNYVFNVGTGRDLYTVFLQEAGHALGVANSPDTTSAMYEFYLGVRSGLSAGDKTEIRRLYGERPFNTWEPVGGNGTATSAIQLNGTGTLVTYGDMANAQDIDWYSFNASTTPQSTIEFRASGMSLLAGRVRVFDSTMRLVGSATAGSAGQNLTITIPNAVAGGKYYVSVEETAGSPFNAGAYQLRIVGAAGSTETVTLGGASALDDNASNENFLSATRLSNIGTSGRTEYRVFAELGPGSDTDVYKVRAPYPGLNQSNVMTATVVAFASNLAPKIVVTNSLGLPVNATITADGKGLYTVQVDNASSGADYLIAVSSRTGQLGAYSMRTTFRSIVTKATTVESGLLTALKKDVSGVLEITGSAQIYFRLSSTLSALLGPSVELQVIDSSSRVRLQLLAQGGDTVEGVALLGPGSYCIRISGNGTFLPLIATDFALQMSLLSDPIGTTPSDPNDCGDETSSPPPPPPPSSAEYKDSKGYYTWGETTPTETYGM